MQRVMKSDEKIERKIQLRIVTIRAVLHNMCSIAAVLSFTFWSVYGTLFFNLLVMIAIHFLFNYRIEYDKYTMFILKFLQSLVTSTTNYLTTFNQAEIQVSPVSRHMPNSSLKPIEEEGDVFISLSYIT